jgi:DNA-binding transcriptional MerR regulator
VTYDDCIIIIVNPRRPLFTASEAHERYSQNLHRTERETIMRSIESRLRQLETKHLSDAASVARWVAAGRFYDELSDEERDLYDRYRGFSLAEASEYLDKLIGRDPVLPHEPLMLNFRNKEEQAFLRERAAEVERILAEIESEFITKANDAGKE